MSFANLSRIGLDKPLRLLLVHAGDAESITWAGLVQPLRLCARAGAGSIPAGRAYARASAAQGGNWHIALLVADETEAPLRAELCRAVIERCRSAPFWGGVGAAVLWLAGAGVMAGVRIACPGPVCGRGSEGRTGHPDAAPVRHRRPAPELLRRRGQHRFFADPDRDRVRRRRAGTRQGSLCVDKVRGKEERQRVALQARFGACSRACRKR
jgi:hypothetical protein